MPTGVGEGVRGRCLPWLGEASTNGRFRAPRGPRKQCLLGSLTVLAPRYPVQGWDRS